MGKNIVIFSDGTGQRSGIKLDENRSNIYKLYRSTRCSPLNKIDPKKQIAFYDPGIGTNPIEANFFSRNWKRFYNIISQATGLGLTKNVIDCYAEIIRQWEPGDRIFLFGFSRGAYTVRCLAGVLDFCGVPTKDGNGNIIKKDIKTTTNIARKAVRDIYRYTDSTRRETATQKQLEKMDIRLALAKRFRNMYGSDESGAPNAHPYFIGVFDTVASLAKPLHIFVLAVIAVLFLVITSYASTFFIGNWITNFIALTSTCFFIYLLWHLRTYLKIPGSLEKYNWWKTLTLTSMTMKFYDNRLSLRVKYARHAISIDEDRASFPREPWGTKGAENPTDTNGINCFEQIWFAGNHSDVGGSYPDNDSRLSDITLAWMLDAAKSVGLLYDGHYLNLYPDSRGLQHDERKSSIFRFMRAQKRTIPSNATLHSTVYERFQFESVLHYDEMKSYRPPSLRNHEALKKYYE